MTTLIKIKPYSTIPIRECGEPLAGFPDDFPRFAPHPYVALGAPYGGASPWMLRETIVQSLLTAQIDLGKKRPGWKIKLFDAYRPNVVQAFMVARELTLLAAQEGLAPDVLTEINRDRLLARVYRLFAIPSADPATPPPHSTGAAFDCTLIDETGREIDMGTTIDENSPRAVTSYFAEATDDAGRAAHANRLFLRDLLAAQGFVQNPNEWWHFSRGDQLAVWAAGLAAGYAATGHAIYGRADLLP
jgi:D-alanyl-D-alanine dipeptidase